MYICNQINRELCMRIKNKKLLAIPKNKTLKTERYV
jgi:hypothetical protein